MARTDLQVKNEMLSPHRVITGFCMISILRLQNLPVEKEKKYEFRDSIWQIKELSVSKIFFFFFCLSVLWNWKRNTGLH